MLSDQELNERISELLMRELSGFECPVCHHHQFAQLDDVQSNLRTNLMLFDGSDPVPRKHTRLISIACTNCGDLEQFAELPLRRRALETAEGAP